MPEMVAASRSIVTWCRFLPKWPHFSLPPTLKLPLVTAVLGLPLIQAALSRSFEDLHQLRMLSLQRLGLTAHLRRLFPSCCRCTPCGGKIRLHALQSFHLLELHPGLRLRPGLDRHKFRTHGIRLLARRLMLTPLRLELGRQPLL